MAAVTSGDNSNVLIARVAKETFGVERVVARIYDPRRATIYQRLGISTVATVAWTTEQVVRRILPDPTGAEWTEPTAHVGVIERQITRPWIGHPLSELEEPLGVRVVAVGRIGGALVPTARTVGQEGDLLYVAAVPLRGGGVRHGVAAERRRPEGWPLMRIVIAGGGSVGKFIAEQLHEQGHDVTILDNDPSVVARARALGRAGRRARGTRAMPARSTR